MPRCRPGSTNLRSAIHYNARLRTPDRADQHPFASTGRYNDDIHSTAQRGVLICLPGKQPTSRHLPPPAMDTDALPLNVVTDYYRCHRMLPNLAPPFLHLPAARCIFSHAAFCAPHLYPAATPSTTSLAYLTGGCFCPLRTCHCERWRPPTFLHRTVLTPYSRLLSCACLLGTAGVAHTRLSYAFTDG